MSSQRRPSIYDQLRPHLDAADLIRRLGIQEARRLGSEAYCKPLCHESTSGESLQINLHTGRWNCKACQHNGVRGDLIQLVEYALSGGRAPSHGGLQGGSGAHREAVLWLCQQYGIPFDEGRCAGDVALDVVHLFSMMAHEYLLATPRVQEWIAERWGFDLATIEAYGLGYMPSPILPELAKEAEQPKSRDAFRSSGLGWFTNTGRWRTRFEGRVTFPYLVHGRAVYLIGRSTPWTPLLDGGIKPPKYHKLSVRSETRSYISESVTNDHLYNEPVMATAETVVVAEGVADAVALSSLGVPVVSPVTIAFNSVDLERFTRKAIEGGITRVEILFDNELSGSGNWAAKRVALKLVEHGLVARILTLPLGIEQQAACEEVRKLLGAELFDELVRSDPLERKKLIENAVEDSQQRAWLKDQINASKIDAAEWTAQLGAGAAGQFDAIRKAGRDVVDLLIEDVLAAGFDVNADPAERAACFSEIIQLVAHVEDSLARGGYAGRIARAAGKGITKADIGQRIAHSRKTTVKPKRADEQRAAKVEGQAEKLDLTVLPPALPHAVPAAPQLPARPPSNPNAPPAPALPVELPVSDHKRFAPVREVVARGVEEKASIELIGEYVAQTILVSMGYTPFRTPEELYLVRGSERIPTGLSRRTARFESLLFLVSGLTTEKSTHRAYIAAIVYFLEQASRRVADVSWSFASPDGAVYFPTGDDVGRILKIEPGKVTRTKMAEARVPAVAGSDFLPFTYVEQSGGVQSVFDVFRWISVSEAERLVLVHWIVCLPILRRIGVVPTMRLQGGTSSGKTRAVEAVSFLVNGKKGSSVPTAAALASRMSVEMLTIDDNRESGDITPAFLSTLLQASHLGAREKRKGSSDTETVVERVCGALLMNGVEPIHDGRSEVASRMLVLKCSQDLRAPDSPAADSVLYETITRHRDAFWSEAIRLCAIALELDVQHGAFIGSQIEAVFGATKIGRLSAYLRLMYLSWAARLDADAQVDALENLDETWRRAFEYLGHGALNSLLKEELAVTCVRYAFAWGAKNAKAATSGIGAIVKTGLDGKYVESSEGEVYLGPLRATKLAEIVREAAKDMNAPPAIAHRLRAGQLEERLLDGVAFLASAGYEASIEHTTAGRTRFTFRKLRGQAAGSADGNGHVPATGDTWTPG